MEYILLEERHYKIEKDEINIQKSNADLPKQFHNNLNIQNKQISLQNEETTLKNKRILLSNILKNSTSQKNLDRINQKFINTYSKQFERISYIQNNNQYFQQLLRNNSEGQIYSYARPQKIISKLVLPQKRKLQTIMQMLRNEQDTISKSPKLLKSIEKLEDLKLLTKYENNLKLNIFPKFSCKLLPTDLHSSKTNPGVNFLFFI